MPIGATSNSLSRSGHSGFMRLGDAFDDDEEIRWTGFGLKADSEASPIRQILGESESPYALTIVSSSALIVNSARRLPQSGRPATMAGRTVLWLMRCLLQAVQ